jgi:glycosyltransferase involved in cell wall biosynthesis
MPDATSKIPDLSPLRVGQICLSTAWGGLEMSTVKMVSLFQKAQDHSVGLCAPGSPILRHLEEQSLPHEVVGLSGYWAPQTALRIRRVIRDHRLEAMFVHSLKDLWPLKLALLGNQNLRVLGFARMFIRGVDKKDPLHRWIYSRLDQLIALSHAQLDLLLECLPVPRDRSVVIPNGVDTDRFKPRAPDPMVRHQLSAPHAKQILIGFVGRIDEQKGALEFVEAARVLAPKFPQCQFVLIGGNTIGGSDLQARIRQMIDSSGLSSRITITDHRSDVPQVLNALDIFVMPSYEENFGNIMLEAMASGLVCLGTNSGGTPEMLDFGKSGVLFEPRSTHALIRALQDTLESAPEKMLQLKQAARSRAESVYAMPAIFGKIRKIALPPSTKL